MVKGIFIFAENVFRKGIEQLSRAEIDDRMGGIDQGFGDTVGEKSLSCADGAHK